MSCVGLSKTISVCIFYFVYFFYNFIYLKIQNHESSIRYLERVKVNLFQIVSMLLLRRLARKIYSILYSELRRPWSQNTERIRSLTVKYGGLTAPSRLNTAQKRPFTVQYLNKTLIFDPFTVVYDDM